MEKYNCKNKSRYDDAFESQACGLADALLGAGRRAHFAR